MQLPKLNLGDELMIFLGSINFRIGLIYWHMDIIFLNLVKIIYYRVQQYASEYERHPQLIVYIQRFVYSKIRLIHFTTRTILSLMAPYPQPINCD